MNDIVKDRTERTNIANQHPDIVEKLEKEWRRWAEANFVLSKLPNKK